MTKNEKNTQGLKIGQECWFVHPKTQTISHGLIVGRLNIDGVWHAFLAIGPKRQEHIWLPMTKLFH